MGLRHRVQSRSPAPDDCPCKTKLLDEMSSLATEHPKTTIYDDWLASRVVDNSAGLHLSAGMQRHFNRTNIQLASRISRDCAYTLFKLFWGLHPVRTVFLVIFNILRGLLPAFRGYSQALIVDEIQSLISSGRFTWTRLSRLIASEVFRMIFESVFESFATKNENIVHSSARFVVEYQQMEQRLRLDVPSLADPAIRDLLHESDLFVRSFSGMGGFGLLSPFDLIRILTSVSELVSQVFVISSMSRGCSHLCILSLTLLSCVLPLCASWLGSFQSHSETLYTPCEARAAERQEKMRNLAYNDHYRPEITLFGLAPWILQSWSSARKSILGLEHPSGALEKRDIFSWAASQMNVTDILNTLQNIPLVLILQSSSVSLGSLALYRSAVQSLIFTVRNLITTTRMAYQGTFLMGAFCAAMTVQPILQPKIEDVVEYQSSPRGLKIEARNLYFTYPGSKDPTLKNVNFSLEAGETLAIVGYNGSGKTTLANILLRIFNFDSGELLINGVDIRRYDPDDYHRHVTALFQGFSRFNATVRENVGIGRIENLDSRTHIEHALRNAGASHIVAGLPKGLRTKLTPTGFEAIPYLPNRGDESDPVHQGLSGGEWQRIAISRAFMRADRPDVDLLLFDEPSSQLDAHAQNNIFDSIDRFSRSPLTGERVKTVVFITHRLSTARRADKIAMFENGTITELGTHEELLRRPQSSYASLYRASV